MSRGEPAYGGNGATPAESAPITVLVADDSATQLRMVEHQLQDAGFSVLTARDGVEGVNRAYTDDPDIIVSDIVMPELNGYQLCRLIKNDWFTAHIPIVLLTSLGQRQDRFWGTECGADAFLQKEGEIDRLPEVIRGLIGSRAPRQSTLTRPILLSASELASATVKSRVNYLLDRLLFQSTVANRIRELTRFLHDERTLVEKFFELLALLEDHEVAVLAFPGADQAHIHLHAARPTGRDVLQQLRRSALESLGVDEAGARLRVSLYGAANAGATHPSPSGDVVTLTVPLDLAHDRHGVLAIARVSRHPFDTENESTFRIVAQEMSVVVSYFVKALETEKLKADFTSMIIHDIRTPMTGIHGYAEILRDGLAGPLAPEQHEMVDSIGRLSERVVELVSDALDVSKIEAGRLDLTLESVPLGDPARAALTSLKPLAEQKKLAVDLVVEGGETAVIVDPQKLEQVFVNLLSNAVKFTPEGGRITVSMQSGAEGWTASVTDTGTGIAAEDLPLLFEKYRSASRARAGIRGTGLGLVIAKSIVEAHGGTISVESRVGEGTTFTIRCPHRENAAEPEVVGL